jgi:DNA invertase Pin-like site-specific DNA recombinase
MEKAGTVVGYLRHYRRWNGANGLTFKQQRAVVRAVARERGYGRCGRLELKEDLDGEAKGWPILQKAIRMAKENEDQNLLVVVPTLDGVQFNLSFLVLVAGDRPVYVCSGWILSITDERDDFAEMVMRVAKRNRALPMSIRKGLKQAAARGKRFGSHRRGSHRITVDEQRKGGQATARKRQQAANKPFAQWIVDIRRWRANGESVRMIAMKLFDKGALTPDGRTIGPMLIHRILRRELWP